MVQTSLLNATAIAAGRYGLPVTIGLIDILDTQMKEAANELEQDRDKYQQEEKGFLSRARSVFQQLVTGRSTPPTRGSRRPSRIVAKHSGGGRRRRSTTSPPSCCARSPRTSCRPCEARSRRRSARCDAARRRSIGPSSSSGPRTTCPPTCARLRTSSYSRDRTRSPPVGQVAGCDVQGLGGRRRRVGGRRGDHRATVAFDGYDDPNRDQKLIEVDLPWRASTPGARAASLPPSPQTSWSRSRRRRCSTRAGLWVRGRRGPVNDHVSGTLAEWLDPKHPNSASRATQFVGQLKHALDCSAPLVTINPATHQAVHGVALPTPKTIIGPIPIGKNHPGYQRAVQALKGAGFPDNQIPGRFNAASRAEQVEISSFLGHTVHPVVFDSLSVPILQDWRSRRTPSARQAFWMYRRARTLPALHPVVSEPAACACPWLDDGNGPWLRRRSRPPVERRATVDMDTAGSAYLSASLAWTGADPSPVGPAGAARVDDPGVRLVLQRSADRAGGLHAADRPGARSGSRLERL